MLKLPASCGRCTETHGVGGWGGLFYNYDDTCNLCLISLIIQLPHPLPEDKCHMSSFFIFKKKRRRYILHFSSFPSGYLVFMANQNISVNFQLCWNMLLWAHQTSEINKSSRVWNTQCVHFWWACLIITNRCHSRQSEVTNHKQDFHLASCSSYFIWAEVDYSCDASVWLVYMYFFSFLPCSNPRRTERKH